jgi:hypothetical protein
MACSTPDPGTGAGGNGGATGRGGNGGSSAGAAGKGGSAGNAGGTGGGAGASGTTGAGGGGGSTGGATGRGGSAGNSGSAGSGGSDAGATGGAAGRSGSAGTAGTGGSSGAAPDGGAGSAGKGGNSGAAGGDAGTGGAGDAGSKDAAIGSDAGDALTACTALADGYCAKLQTCSTFVMSVAYGDLATCKARWILNCTPNFGAAGTSATPSRTSACAASIPALSCSTFLSGALGAACDVAGGTLANGSACGDDAQCSSTFCARAPESLCGTCQPITDPGDTCVQKSCSTSSQTVCVVAKNTCVTPKAGQIGDSCIGHEECDVGHQVGCNPVSSKCIALTLSSAGGTCGADSIIPSKVGVCPAAGTCSSQLNGKCSAAAADGASCSTADTGAHCMLPARCVGGKCTLPAPATCK